jgi:hypothetical protein
MGAIFQSLFQLVLHMLKGLHVVPAAYHSTRLTTNHADVHDGETAEILKCVRLRLRDARGTSAWETRKNHCLGSDRENCAN